jgi:hypothetical protein
MACGIDQLIIGRFNDWTALDENDEEVAGIRFEILQKVANWLHIMDHRDIFDSPIEEPFLRMNVYTTIMLWTWQGFDFNPPFYPIDRSKSKYLIHNSCPDIHRAYEELDELLSLPTDKKGQFVWCCTTDSWDGPWYNCYIWPIDVPQDSILAYVNNPIWEHLIGSKSVPKNIRKQWEIELFSQQISGDRYYEEMDKKESEYHNSFPSRKECLEILLNPTKPGENVTALVHVPIDVSWIRPHDLKEWRRSGVGISKRARSRFR